MAYEIIGETIKSATSIKLGEIFGSDTKRYKENVTNMQYPNFFIQQLTQNITPDTKDRWMIDYLVTIRYRYVKDTTTVTNLEQKLDEIGLKLTTEFTELQLEKPVKVKNARYEKDEGVLHFFFNVSVQIKRLLEEKPRQENLKVNENIINEEVV